MYRTANTCLIAISIVLAAIALIVENLTILPIPRTGAFWFAFAAWYVLLWTPLRLKLFRRSLRSSEKAYLPSSADLSDIPLELGCLRPNQADVWEGRMPGRARGSMTAVDPSSKMMRKDDATGLKRE
jgi:hypothetical protein